MGAVWLGVLTSISPCPLATNIAAISFVGKRVDSPRYVLWAGGLYTLGRVAAYVLLGALIVGGLFSVPGTSAFLQARLAKYVGPMLTVVGAVLVGWIQFSLPGMINPERMQRIAEKGGLLGAVLLGLLFALSFCPVSAGLFFGALIPLCVAGDSVLWLPALYGVGTGLPVIVFAVLLGFGAARVGAAFGRIRQFEQWARWITGGVFIAAGIYLSLRDIWHMI